MKTNRLTLLGSFISLFVIVGCQRNLQNEFPSPPSTSVNLQSVQKSVQRPVNQSTISDAAAYSITLIDPIKVNENYEWVWTIKNNKPGNGKNGTVQDLSHWGMKFGTCFDWTSVVGAAYSSDGIHWTSFKPTLQLDPSSCLSEPVLKFDFGTNGSNTSYFRLILNKQYDIYENASGYIKSGRNTGCTQIYFRGIESCEGS